MSDKTCRKIALGVSIGAAVLALINLILCFRNDSIDTSGFMRKFMNNEHDALFSAVSELYYAAILYKICIFAVVIAIVLMTISYFECNKGALGVIVIVCRGLQVLGGILEIITSLISSYYVGLGTIGIATLELIVFILFMIDRRNRKRYFQIMLLSLWTAFASSILHIMFYIGMVVIALVLLKIFLFPSKPKDHYIDETTGHVYTRERY